MNGRIVVIGGGQSAEHDVSLASAAAVARALGRSGRDVLELTIARDGRWVHESSPLAATPAASLGVALTMMEAADAVFPLLHGTPGEDGAIAALCALAGIRFAGTPLTAGAVGMDKHLTKVVATSVGVPVAPGVLVADLDDLGAACDLLEVFDAVVVKPVTAGSSHGVRLVHDVAELREGVIAARAFDPRVLVEPAIRGREIDVAVLRDADGTRFAAPPLEISAAGVFDTAQKYDGTAVFTVPAQLEPHTTRALRRAATRIFDALGCAGVARMDFFVTEDGIILNEVNTTPGMTEHSQVPRMFAAAGIDYAELVGRIVASAAVPSQRPTRVAS